MSARSARRAAKRRSARLGTAEARRQRWAVLGVLALLLVLFAAGVCFRLAGVERDRDERRSRAALN